MRSIVIALFALAPCIAGAQIVSSAPDEVEVAIYRASPGNTADIANMDLPANGLAMISETRTIDLPVGTVTILFRGVAETIVPQSAKLESLPGNIRETNFDYRLIGPGELVANSIGKSVRLIRTDRQTGNVSEQRGTLLAGPQGVLLDIEGRIEALGCSGASERLVFDEVPTSLTAHPTLSATVNVTKAGRHRVRLSYLAIGLDWSADYVARIHADGKKLDLSGWITLANKQRTSFADAQVHVVAGNVSVMRDQTVPQTIEPLFMTSSCWPIGSFVSYPKEQRMYKRSIQEDLQSFVQAPMPMMSMAKRENYIAKQTDLGDYKLYTVPVATTVSAKQIKQVRMVNQKNVPFERLYSYQVDEHQLENENVPTTPTIVLRLQNKKNAGLGVALPAGKVAVMEPHTAGLVLAGEQTVKDLPVGLPVEIEIGQAMDIKVRPRAVRQTVNGEGANRKERIDIEVDVANDKPIPITLELFQQKTVERDFRIVVETQLHTEKNGMPMWTVKLKPGERTTIAYTVEHAN
jgi:hypothetical protein